MGIGSNALSTFFGGLKKFSQDKRGQVAMTMGLAAIPIFGAVGVGVDFARKIEAQSITQAALDGAALAATAAFNAGENQATYEAAAQQFFDNNKPNNLVGSPQVQVQLDLPNGMLSVSADVRVKTSMSKVLGFDNLKISNGDDGKLSTGVSLPAFTVEHKGEIVMVMDYSGSMNWYLGGERKYKTMRNEAAKLVSALSQAKTNQYVKFGVVPFSSEVFATMPKKFWYGYKGNTNRASCSRDRKYPYNLSAATPLQPKKKKHITRFGWVKEQYSSNPNKYGFYQGWENYRNNCSNYSGWRNLEVQDLTGNHTDTYNKILSMSPLGYTHIAVGMEFGWHLLSPNAPFTAGVSYNDSTTEKAIILLTDGAQTTRAFGAGNSYTVSKGEQNLATLCANIKAAGIRILTVSYDLYDADTENRLRTCASSLDDFYDADTKPELVAAFSGITAKLARDMYLAK